MAEEILAVTGTSQLQKLIDQICWQFLKSDLYRCIIYVSNSQEYECCLSAYNTEDVFG